MILIHLYVLLRLVCNIILIWKDYISIRKAKLVAAGKQFQFNPHQIKPFLDPTQGFMISGGLYTYEVWMNRNSPSGLNNPCSLGLRNQNQPRGFDFEINWFPNPGSLPVKMRAIYISSVHSIFLFKKETLQMRLGHLYNNIDVINITTFLFYPEFSAWFLLKWVLI